MLAVLKTLWFFVRIFQDSLVVESNSLNMISWISPSTATPWRLQFYFSEIKYLSSLIQVEFKHVERLANSYATPYLNKGWRDPFLSSFHFVIFVFFALGIMLFIPCLSSHLDWLLLSFFHLNIFSVINQVK